MSAFLVPTPYQALKTKLTHTTINISKEKGDGSIFRHQHHLALPGTEGMAAMLLGLPILSKVKNNMKLADKLTTLQMSGSSAQTR